MDTHVLTPESGWLLKSPFWVKGEVTTFSNFDLEKLLFELSALQHATQDLRKSSKKDVYVLDTQSIVDPAQPLVSRFDFTINMCIR